MQKYNKFYEEIKQVLRYIKLVFQHLRIKEFGTYAW